MTDEKNTHTTTTTKEGHVYESVPESEAPPAYVPSETIKASGDSKDADTATEDDDEQILAEEANDFELGLFECFNHPKLCVAASFAEPCLFARTSRTMRRSEDEDPAELENKWSSYLNIHSAMYTVVSLYSRGVGNLCWRTMRRGELRKRYNIKGNVCKDLSTTMCCDPCALAQEDYEVSKRETERYTAFKQSQQSLEDEYMV